MDFNSYVGILALVFYTDLDTFPTFLICILFIYLMIRAPRSASYIDVGRAVCFKLN